MVRKIVSGNLNNKYEEHPEGRGWFMGHFAEGEFKTNDLEVSWGVQKKGDKKNSIGTNLKAKTLFILINGEFLHRFPDENKEIRLSNQGDFILWDNGVSHTWEAITDSLSVVIRWPSVQGDQIKNKDPNLLK